jgi:hypothetical protein
MYSRDTITSREAGMEKSIHTITELSVGAARIARNLAWFPLSGNGPSPEDYVLVDEALRVKKVVVEEVNEGGSVPVLRLVNFTGKHVLIPDGTELVGAKQNRIVNASFLVAPDTSTTIPVSCVEQGRWNYSSPTFDESRFHAGFSTRRGITYFQSANRNEGGVHGSDQGRVWSDVAGYSEKMGVSSPTGALNDVYEQTEKVLEDYAGKIATDGTETGGAFFVGGRFLALDLFDRPSTYGALFGKLLKAASLEAVPGAAKSPGRKRPERSEGEMGESLARYLADISTAFFDVHAPVGVGEDWRYEGKRSFGKALHFEGALLHLSAFPR